MGIAGMGLMTQTQNHRLIDPTDFFKGPISYLAIYPTIDTYWVYIHNIPSESYTLLIDLRKLLRTWVYNVDDVDDHPFTKSSMIVHGPAK